MNAVHGWTFLWELDLSAGAQNSAAKHALVVPEPERIERSHGLAGTRTIRQITGMPFCRCSAIHQSSLHSGTFCRLPSAPSARRSLAMIWYTLCRLCFNCKNAFTTTVTPGFTCL